MTDDELERQRIQQDEGVQLKKRLNVPLGAMFIVNYVVGSGIFVTPQLVLKESGSFGMALVVWLVAGLVIICGSMMSIELGTMLPLAGGAYEHILIGLHRIAGYLVAWGYFVMVTPSAIAAGSLSFGNYLLAPFFPCGSPLYPRVILAIAAIWIFVFLNAFSIPTVNALHKVFAGGKVATLTAVVIMGVIGAAHGGYKQLDKPFSNTSRDALTTSLAFHSALFTYSGWNGLNSLAEEMKNPSRNLPMASALGLGIVMIFYLLVNVSYMFVLTNQEIKMSEATVVTFAAKMWEPLGIIFSILVALSILGFIACELNQSSRILYGAARRGHLPYPLRLLTIYESSPAVAVITVGIISTLYLAAGEIESLVYMASFAEASFFILLAVTFFVLRWKHPEVERPFRAFVGFPIAFCLVILAILVISLAAAPQSCAVAAVVVVSGLIFYPLVRYRKSTRFVTIYDKFTIIMEKLLMSVAGAPIPERISIEEALKLSHERE